MPRRRWQAYAPRLAVQLGGAAGTLAASSELARLARGLPEPAHVSWRLVESVASALGLVPSVPWHTSRTVITAAGDAFVGCTDAYGRIAANVATSRPEIAELAEGSGGGSSTMPQKHNPVLSVLIPERSDRTASCLTLHLAAATNVDERPDGSWHAEWATLP